MKKYKNLILFIVITFLRSVFLAAFKFFLRSYLKGMHISLEEIVWYLSLWGILAYLIWSSLAYAFPKKNIVIFSGLLVIICLAIGNSLNYRPFRGFIFLVTGIGFGYSLRLVIKSIILSMEIQKTQNGEAKINGITNIAILLGMLLWSYLWLSIFSKRGTNGFQIIISVLVLSSTLTMLMEYDDDFEAESFSQKLKHAIPNMISTTKRYIRLLMPIWVLRAISTAIAQKMLELGVDVFEKTPKSSIQVLLVSFAWIIIGHLISVFFKRGRRSLAIVFTITFGLLTVYFPHIINRYEYYSTLNIFWLLWGIFAGMSINLLEGRYFFHIGDDHRKEYGSVAYGIVTSVMIFIFMIAADYLSRKVGMKISFFFFGIVLLLMPFFIKKFDAPDIPRKILRKKT